MIAPMNAAVEQVLEEIGAGGRPMVIALNKVDLLSAGAPLELTGLAAKLPAVRVSALQRYGIDALLRCISENLVLQFVVLDVLIPYGRGDLVAAGGLEAQAGSAASAASADGSRDDGLPYSVTGYVSPDLNGLRGGAAGCGRRGRRGL